MLDASPHPYDAPELPAAPIGHNSRAYEIKKAAEEIKAQYLRDNLKDGVSNKVKILYAASISSMSDAAFRQLFVSLSFANRDCNNLTVGHRRVAMLLDRSERSVQRVAKELEEAGWLSEPKRQGRSPAVRSASIPDKALNAIIFEIFDATNVSDRKEVPDLSLRKAALQDLADRSSGSTISNGQNAHLRPVKSDGRTIEYNHGVVVMAPARESADALVEEDYAEYHKLFRAWGRKPGQFFETMGGIARGFSDRHLDGALRALAKFPQAIRVEAARMTIVSMQARNALEDQGHRGPRGFGNYFQQELRGQAELLLERQNKPYPAAASPPPAAGRREQEKAAKDKLTQDLNEFMRTRS